MAVRCAQHECGEATLHVRIDPILYLAGYDVRGQAMTVRLAEQRPSVGRLEWRLLWQHRAAQKRNELAISEPASIHVLRDKALVRAAVFHTDSPLLGRRFDQQLAHSC